MTDTDILDAIDTFQRYGVPQERIFNEVMRARYLDYVLFLNPTNVQYGISIDDLYENMKRTADKLGMYEGDADTYAKVYTLALRVEPMVFAPDVPSADEGIHSLLRAAVKKAADSGNTILFAGADAYLPYLDEAFKELGGKRIAVAVKDPAWKERLQLVFPRGRAMVMDELAADTETYDYIFDAASDGISSACQLRHVLSAQGAMDVLLPYEDLVAATEEAEVARKELAQSQKLVSYYDTEILGKEYAFLRFGGETSAVVTFGESGYEDGVFIGYDRLQIPMSTFIEANDWNYDLYAYNGEPAIQMLLSGNVVQPEHSIGKAFRVVAGKKLPVGTYPLLSAECIEESGIRADKVESAQWEEDTERPMAQTGDVVVTVREGKVYVAVVSKGVEALAQEGVLVLRPCGIYSGEYLKLYLDGPVGQLFLETMKAGETYHMTASRLLRIPLPQASAEKIEMISRLCRETTQALAQAEAAWRKAKRDSVALMMGH